MITSYLRAYGPATIRNFGHWLSRGRVGARQIRAWFAALGDRLREVEVEGDRVYVLAEDLEELAGARPSAALRLLPGFDQYVLGPGTEDAHVLPTKRRTAVSRQSGWIAPIVVAGGLVSGTWSVDGEHIRIEWFSESGRPPRKRIDDEVGRLSTILGRPLRPQVVLS